MHRYALKEAKEIADIIGKTLQVLGVDLGCLWLIAQKGRELITTLDGCGRLRKPCMEILDHFADPAHRNTSTKW